MNGSSPARSRFDRYVLRPITDDAYSALIALVGDRLVCVDPTGSRARIGAAIERAANRLVVSPPCHARVDRLHDPMWLAQTDLRIGFADVELTPTRDGDRIWARACHLRTWRPEEGRWGIAQLSIEASANLPQGGLRSIKAELDHPWIPGHDGVGAPIPIGPGDGPGWASRFSTKGREILERLRSTGRATVVHGPLSEEEGDELNFELARLADEANVLLTRVSLRSAEGRIG